MVDDLSDAWAEIRALKKDIERLKAVNPLEAASVTSGRVRFIGGELRIDSGGRLIIEGTLSVDGVTTVTGSFTVSGPWNLTGNGTITGNVTISGTVQLTGNMTVTGNINVTGAGRVTIGAMTLDPSSNGGSLKFSGGPEVYASGGTLALYSTSSGAFIELGSTAKINGPGARYIEINSTGFQFVGLPTKTAASTGLPAGAGYFDASNYLFKVV